MVPLLCVLNTFHVLLTVTFIKPSLPLSAISSPFTLHPPPPLTETLWHAGSGYLSRRSLHLMVVTLFSLCVLLCVCLLFLFCVQHFFLFSVFLSVRYPACDSHGREGHADPLDAQEVLGEGLADQEERPGRSSARRRTDHTSDVRWNSPCQ